MTLPGAGGRHSSIVRATHEESRVTDDLWDEFLTLVDITPVADLHSVLRTWARRYPVTGPPSRHFLPLVRVTGKGDFSRALEGQLTRRGTVLPAGTIDDIVSDLVSSHRWKRGLIRAHTYGLNLSYWPAWGTFDERSRRYGGLMGMSAMDIASDLGLDDPAGGGKKRTLRDLPLLVFEYLPDPSEARFPTMIDAWAGEAINYFFRPAAAGAAWGLTHPWPWPPNPITSTARPEVLHEASPIGGVQSRMLEVR